MANDFWKNDYVPYRVYFLAETNEDKTLPKLSKMIDIYFTKEDALEAFEKLKDKDKKIMGIFEGMAALMKDVTPTPKKEEENESV